MFDSHVSCLGRVLVRRQEHGTWNTEHARLLSSYLDECGRVRQEWVVEIKENVGQETLKILKYNA